MALLGILVIIAGIIWLINVFRKPYETASSNLNIYWNIKDVIYGIMIIILGVILMVM